jgi:hypothetical protein
MTLGERRSVALPLGSRQMLTGAEYTSGACVYNLIYSASMSAT